MKTQKTKKILSIFMAVITIFTSFVISSYALGVDLTNYSLEELRGEFTVTEFNNEKYAFYSPVKDETDDTKYPLLVFLHGFGHETSYLSKSWFPYYACP